MTSPPADPVGRPLAPIDRKTDRDLARENWTLQCRLAETQHSLRQARAEIDRMLTSRSWRATRFMRLGLDGLRRMLRPQGAIAPAPSLRPVAGFAAPIPRGDERLLMVDVTELAIENLQGGIQHTVKGILSEWLLAPPAGWQVVPVQLTAEGVYVSASRDLEHLFGLFDDPWAGRRVAAREGDVFLGLDLLRDHASVFRTALERLRGEGARVEVVVYDLLPIDLAHCVPDHIHRSFVQWLDVVGDLTDGAVCISRTVADHFASWLSRRGGRNSGVAVTSFRLGVPMLPTPAQKPAKSGSGDFLMVGTVEPRKGYVDALDAFERLWAAAPTAEVSLTIIGRYGWGLPDFLVRLETHPELGRRLRWLRTATDDDVHASYESADALLFCSYGEGFGLPIVEAAQHGLPMILRDLPEFREVAGDGALFFSGEGGGAVEDAVRTWLRLHAQGAAPAPSQGVAITWQQSAGQLLSVIEAAASQR